MLFEAPEGEGNGGLRAVFGKLLRQDDTLDVLGRAV